MNSLTLKKQLHANNTPVAEHLSDQYAPISTNILLAPFFNRGWYIHKSKNNFNKDGIGKEHVTLRHDNYVYPNGDFLTVECLNGNNGYTPLNFFGGYGRLVCQNGLVVGDLEGGRFVHRGTSIYDRIEDQYDRIVAHLETIKANINTLQNTVPDNDTVDRAIDRLVSKMFDVTNDKVVRRAVITEHSRDQIKFVWRHEDMGKDAFTLLNVIQENIIRRGRLRYRLFETDPSTGVQTVSPIKQKRGSEMSLNSLKLNKQLTESFLEVVA